jgi:hypothetical protein
MLNILREGHLPRIRCLSRGLSLTTQKIEEVPLGVARQRIKSSCQLQSPRPGMEGRNTDLTLREH